MYGKAGAFWKAVIKDRITFDELSAWGDCLCPSTGIVNSPYYTPKFIPDPGVKSELIVPANILTRWSDGTYLDFDSPYGRDYTPVSGQYTLKLRNGNEIVIDGRTGDMLSITDLSENTLNYTGMGIIHSSGRGVDFERHNGRITAVIDPAGNRIEYGYDTQGNLTSVTDRADATTTFTYLESPDHYLDQVIDPYGRPAARTEYDAEGRIKTITDADGQTIEYEWNGESKVQKITNQLGHTSTIETDARGNVVREADPEGGIILRAYDGKDNLLSETVVVGQLDTPENEETNDLTTTYTYDPATGDKLSEKDARGVTTEYTYNDHGQLTFTSRPGASSPSTVYDDRGLPNWVQDANGQITDLEFNGRGNLTSMTNGAGVTVMHATYNKYGEILTSTPAEGTTISAEYDVNGDQVATWHFGGQGDDEVQILNVTMYDDARRKEGSLHAVLPYDQFITENLGTATIPSQYVVSSSSTTFNLSGQVLSTTDQYGRVRENTYDFRGRQIQTRIETVDEDGDHETCFFHLP